MLHSKALWALSQFWSKFGALLSKPPWYALTVGASSFVALKRKCSLPKCWARRQLFVFSGSCSSPQLFSPPCGSSSLVPNCFEEVVFSVSVCLNSRYMIESSCFGGWAVTTTTMHVGHMILKVVNTVTPKPCNPRLFGTAGFYGSTVLEPLLGWLFHLDVNAE